MPPFPLPAPPSPPPSLSSQQSRGHSLLGATDLGAFLAVLARLRGAHERHTNAERDAEPWPAEQQSPEAGKASRYHYLMALQPRLPAAEQAGSAAAAWGACGKPHHFVRQNVSESLCGTRAQFQMQSKVCLYAPRFGGRYFPWPENDSDPPRILGPRLEGRGRLQQTWSTAACGRACSRAARA